MKRLRILVLVVGAAGLLFGALWERHTVRRLDDGAPATVNGPAFVAGAAVDDYLLKDGDLFAVNSLAPQGATAKDCKT